MWRATARRRTLAALAFLLVGTPLLQAAQVIRSSGNAQFEVIGLDQRSVSYVNELSQITAQIAERYLEREGMHFPLPILVSLRPAAHADFESDYRIRLVERGGVQLDLLWEDPLTLHITCRALTEALLLQYALYNYGVDAAQQVRAWPVAALAEEVYFRLRPAKFVSLLQATRRSEVPVLSSLVETFLSDASTGEAAVAYWLLQAIKADSSDRSVARRLFQQALAGYDVADALNSVVHANDPAAESSVQTWWAAQLADLLGREYEVIESMSTSRAWLASLARFSDPLMLESEEVVLDLRALWKHRTQPQLQEWLQARYEILRLRMTRINPAYYNAARSLGVLYEAVLSDAPIHSYLHALTIYLSDWEDAKDMQQAIEKILNQE